MTPEARVAAVAALGFTPRQARFLVTVLLHAGVCQARHYATFAGIQSGQTTTDLVATLVRRRLATVVRGADGQTHLVHLHSRALYAAIGEPHSRFRKPTPLARAVERLMILDAVLARPDVTWLATERDLLAHVALTLPARLTREDLPQLTFTGPRGTTVRYFPDRLPIGVQADGTHVLTYLVTKAVPVDFRPFLGRHAALVRALAHWRIVLLVPRHLATAVGVYAAAWREEWGRPLRLSTVEELRWYVEQRRVRADRPARVGDADAARYAQAREAFAAPRFQVLYRTWRAQGSTVLEDVVSPVLADAIQRGTGQLEVQVLPYPYLRLSRLVGTA